MKPVFHLVKSVTHCKRLFYFVEMKIYLVIGFLWTAIMGSCHLYAQDSLQVANAKKATKKIEQALEKKDPVSLAQGYESLADNYQSLNDFSKAEEFYEKARKSYEGVNDRVNARRITRKLAQVQEKQNKIQAAAKNYQYAIEPAMGKNDRSSNDLKRIKSRSLVAKEQAIKENISLSKNNDAELATGYEQLAEINVQQNNFDDAEQNLSRAYNISKANAPQKAVEFNQRQADLYVSQNNFDKAIETKKKVLKEDFVQQNTQKKIQQMQELASIYAKSSDIKNAVDSYKKAYEIAVDKGYTLEAKKSVEKLDSLYALQKNTEYSLTLHRNFLTKLPDLVANDQSLISRSVFQETESKIMQLEKEKQLQDTLIQKTNRYNTLLIVIVLLLLLSLAGIIYSLKKSKRKSQKIALQSLRREMNPHFIFNSLNSVNQFISQNDERAANRYLTNFSKLMRGIMENSNQDFISFHEELEVLEHYLTLEKSRFKEKFDFEVIVDEHLETENMTIPGMLIQPFLENAIWHGLRYKEEKGKLELRFKKENRKLKIEIEDNGIGIQNSQSFKTKHQRENKSRGMKNTLERIELLNSLYRKNIQCIINDKPNGNGVLVSIEIDV